MRRLLIATSNDRQLGHQIIRRDPGIRALRHLAVFALLVVADCSTDRSGSLAIVNYTTTNWHITIKDQSGYSKNIVVPGAGTSGSGTYPAFAIEEGTYTVTATTPSHAFPLTATLIVLGSVNHLRYECSILTESSFACSESHGSGSPATLIGPR